MVIKLVTRRSEWKPSLRQERRTPAIVSLMHAVITEAACCFCTSAASTKDPVGDVADDEEGRAVRLSPAGLRRTWRRNSPPQPKMTRPRCPVPPPPRLRRRRRCRQRPRTGSDLTSSLTEADLQWAAAAACRSDTRRRPETTGDAAGCRPTSGGTGWGKTIEFRRRERAWGRPASMALRRPRPTESPATSARRCSSTPSWSTFASATSCRCRCLLPERRWTHASATWVQETLRQTPVSATDLFLRRLINTHKHNYVTLAVILLYTFSLTDSCVNKKFINSTFLLLTNCLRCQITVIDMTSKCRLDSYYRFIWQPVYGRKQQRLKLYSKPNTVGYYYRSVRTGRARHASCRATWPNRRRHWPPDSKFDGCRCDRTTWWRRDGWTRRPWRRRTSRCCRSAPCCDRPRCDRAGVPASRRHSNRAEARRSARRRSCCAARTPETTPEERTGRSIAVAISVSHTSAHRSVHSPCCLIRRRFSVSSCSQFFPFYFRQGGGYVFPLFFVCLLAGLCKNYSTDVTKFSGKVAHEPRKNPVDFCGKPDRVTSVLGLAW